MSDGFDAASWAPLPLRAAPAVPDAVPALLAWAAAAGVWFEPIEIAVAPDGNRTVRARVDLPAGAPLVVAPRTAMITDVDVAAHPVIAAVRSVEDMLATRHSTMGLWLVLEAADPASRWRGYLDALPPAYPWLALHRPAADLAALTHTRALAMIVDQAEGCRGDRARIVDAVPDLADVALADFTWGRLVAGTRCFRVAARDGSVRALVPVADMFDHGRIDATWGYDDAAQRFEVRAARALTAGQEIQISYGAHDNALFASTHGFALPANPEDEIVVHLPTDRGGRALALGTRYDHRFHRAMATAVAWPGDTDTDALLRIAGAAAATSAAIAVAPAPPPGDAAWAALCATVRASERAIAAAIVAFVDELTAAGCERPPEVWRDVVAASDPAATGAARLLREFAQHALA